MRTQLEDIFGKRQTFTGVFIRYGKKRAFRGRGTMGDGYDETVLLNNVKDSARKIVADHLWFNLTQGFDAACMSPGDIVEFDARVDSYIKGYERDSHDYKLSRPTKISVIGVDEAVVAELEATAKEEEDS